MIHKSKIKYVICPFCNGDSIERCDNPDHSFIEMIGGELYRLGCPVCGHDDEYRVKHWNPELSKYEWNKCPYCDSGELEESEAIKLCEEYDKSDKLIYL